MMGPEIEEVETEELEEETTVEETEPQEGEETETEGPKETPLWMQEEGEQEPSNMVPEAAIINVKRKLKGQVRERDDEITKLKLENEQLKQSQAPVAVTPPKRPRASDFDTDEAYEGAMDAYDAEKLEFQTKTLSASQAQKSFVEQQAKRVEVGIDGHYTRAAKLVADNGISPEVYQQADLNVKQVIDEIVPGVGEQVFNQFIALMGEGSEKTMFFVGRNKAARDEFRGVLAADKSGLAAAYHLGKVTARINGTQSTTSRAPKPAVRIKGDTATSAKGGAFKRKYDEAHKKGDAQAAYNLKKDARSAGVDTTNWR